MPQSLAKIIVHITFSTKNRVPCPPPCSSELGFLNLTSVVLSGWMVRPNPGSELSATVVACLPANR